MSEHQQMQQSGKPDSTFQKQAALISQTHVSHPASIIQRARIDPKSLTSADVLQLQRTIGNRAVGRLLSEIRSPSTVQQAPIQRQSVPEEEKEPLQGMFGKEPDEETCPSCVQRQEKPEEEEPLQGKFETIQRQEPEDNEKLQMKSVVQRQKISEEEEPLQGKMAEPIQRQEISEEEREPIQGKMIGTIQRQEIPEEEPLQKKSENNTGMPDNLKAGVESLSGIDMSDVRVNYNSSKPAEVGALAYTQGINIHVAPGQERHLPHEAWHVVQQAQGRVRPTMQLKGISVNDDDGLEREANEMGVKAIESRVQKDNIVEFNPLPHRSKFSQPVIQCLIGNFVGTTPAEGSTIRASGNPLRSVPFGIEANFVLQNPTEVFTNGEYRQYIKGAYRQNGVPQVHQLDSGPMSETEWKEDAINGVRYGYRQSINPNQRYSQNGNGPNYSMLDCPFAVQNDDEMDLHFLGILIDKGHGYSIIARRLWNVYGNRRQVTAGSQRC